MAMGILNIPIIMIKAYNLLLYVCIYVFGFRFKYVVIVLVLHTLFNSN